jgi:two-component system sensor histidine kinase YesM
MRIRITNPLTRMNLKQQLVLLFVIMVSPVFILHWYGNVTAENILKRHVTNAYVELIKQNHIVIKRDIDTVNKITTTMIQNSIVQQLLSNEKDSTLQRVKKYELADELLDANSVGINVGHVIYYSLYVYDPFEYHFFAPKVQTTNRGVYFFSDHNRPDWMDDIIQLKGKGSLRIIDNYGIHNNQTTLSYVRAVNSVNQTDQLIGVLIATNLEKKIMESLQTVSLPNVEMFFTDWSNQILASTNSDIGKILELPTHSIKGDSLEGTIHVTSSEHLFVIDYNSVLKQKLIYKIPLASLLKQQSELKRIIQIISLVYTILGIMMMIYFWKSLMSPLQKLVGFVRLYEPGNQLPDAPHNRRDDEVGVLIASVHGLARRLNVLFHSQYLMEIKQKETQLQILYQQINPHLLYNTLESIYWKSSLEGKTESAEMIKELSKLMKIALSKGKELITLEEELHHAAAYIRLQQLRYDYGFQVTWNIDDELLGVSIPKITLQPLIENAIIHGVKNMGEDGEIVLSARAVGNKVMVCVEDNGYKEVDYYLIEKILQDENADPLLGYGIRNIQQRIQLHFGKSYGISYRRREGRGTEVMIALPLHSDSE